MRLFYCKVRVHPERGSFLEGMDCQGNLRMGLSYRPEALNLQLVYCQIYRLASVLIASSFCLRGEMPLW